MQQYTRESIFNIYFKDFLILSSILLVFVKHLNTICEAFEYHCYELWPTCMCIEGGSSKQCQGGSSRGRIYLIPQHPATQVRKITKATCTNDMVRPPSVSCLHHSRNAWLTYSFLPFSYGRGRRAVQSCVQIEGVKNESKGLQETGLPASQHQ